MKRYLTILHAYNTYSLKSNNCVLIYEMSHLPENNPNPVFSVGSDGTIFYSNEAGVSLLHKLNMLVDSKLPAEMINLVQTVISQNSSEKMEVKVGDNAYLISFHSIPEKNCVNVYGFDISDRKQLEIALSESEEKYRNIVETANEGIWVVGADLRTTYVNEKLAEMLGYSREEMNGKYGRDFADNENKVLLEQTLEERQKGISEIYELKLIRKDGSPIWMLVNTKSILDENGKFAGSLGMLTDITERKKAEKALCEAYEKLQGQSEELQVSNEELRVQSDELVEANVSLHDSVIGFRTLADNSPDLIARFDRQNHCLYANPAITLFYDTPLVATFYGISAKEFAYKTGHEVQIDPEMIKLSEKQRDNVFTTGKPESMEFKYVSPQGKEYWFDTRIVPEFIDGKVVSVLVLSRDITIIKDVEAKLKETLDNLEEKVKERTAELEKAYDSLKESEECFAEAQRISHIGNWEWDIVPNKIYLSDEVYRIYRFPPQDREATYNMFLSYLHPDDRDRVDDAFKMASKEKPISVDYRIILDNGEERVIHAQGEIIYNEENIRVRTRGTFQDITEQKKIEDKIRKLANAVESSNDAIITESFVGIIESWNKGAEQIYGYLADEILGKNVSILEPDNLKGEIKQLIKKTKQEEKIQHYETLRLRKDGTIINAAVTISPVYDASGKFVAVSAISRDITEQKKAERALANNELARKKEIHHRIKNNLQVVSSLLDLQADKFRDKMEVMSAEVVNAFKESQDRIASMALIHEELYKDGNMEELHFAPYVVNLTDHLLKTYNVKDVSIDLQMNVANDAYFNMDIAVPLGIIINELVSNSFKYAFKGRDKGEIRIKLGRNGSDKESTNFILEVADNGIGVSDNLNIEDLDSLGMQLVTSLVDQLDGTLNLHKNNGTEFIMKFPVTENHSGD